MRYWNKNSKIPGQSAVSDSMATSGPAAGAAQRASGSGLRLAANALEAVGVALPLVALIACAFVSADASAAVSMGAVAVALVCLFASYELRCPQLRDIMPTVVLTAAAVAGRLLFAAIPDFKPVSAIAIMAGVLFGRQSGFMVGALAALVSNFFLGQGPWTLWQMYAWGMVGYVAGCLARTGAMDKMPVVLTWGFAFALMYGLIINSWSVVGFYHPETLGQAALIYAAALPFDFTHGVATVVFLLALFAPWKRKLLRVRDRYGLQG